VVANTVEWTADCGRSIPCRRQNIEAQAPPAQSTADVRMRPLSVKTPETRPPVVSSPRTAQFWCRETPRRRAASASAGAATAGSARPSFGDTTPPIQSCPLLPGVSSRASSGPIMRLCAWYLRAMATQASQLASSAGSFVT
jgi:hypothetical protein